VFSCDRVGVAVFYVIIFSGLRSATLTVTKTFRSSITATATAITTAAAAVVAAATTTTKSATVAVAATTRRPVRSF